MSPKLPVMKPDELIKLLEREGFQIISQKGSHLKMKSETGETVIIPVHSGKNIKPGLLLSILNRVGFDVSELRR
ncbi:MAG: type II toxin-antitoxin system HicA family toxin [Synergistaceae bacterium]|nr:type II toxin-antitoxin system HicA family toxin [Synergistaceae bacterium]